MRRYVRSALGVVAALCCALALYNGLVREEGCGVSVLAAFSDDTDCAERSGGNAGQALLWVLVGMPATLAYAAMPRDDE